MIRAIMGAGPRTGTSWTMHRLAKAGLPVHHSKSLSAIMPPEGNPQGYYECYPADLLNYENTIAKVWPITAQPEIIEKMVVLYRDRTTQLASIERQLTRERTLLEAAGIDWTAEEHLDRSLLALEPLLGIPHLAIRTEELDERISDITNYLRY